MAKFTTIVLIFIIQIGWAQNDSTILVLQHVNIIDAYSNKTLINHSILIDHGKIKSIGKKVETPAEAVIVDLSNRWLLPGYVDAHTHFESFKAAQNAVTFGVTTARTMNCRHFIDIEIRDAHKNGRTDVPEIIAGGYQMRPDMFDEFFEDFPELSDLKPRVSGAENVRKIVRANISRGVNHIKILATERGGTPDTDPRRRTFNDEELAAILDEASKANLTVAAHAHGDEGGAAAVNAGVRSIEHGSFLSPNTLALMKQKGTYLNSTLSLAYVYDTLSFIKNNPKSLQTLMEVRKGQTEVIQQAYKLGIPIVGSTDSDYTMVPKFNVAREAVQLKEIGLSNRDAIKAITINAAQLLKVDDHTGKVQEGYDADLVIVNENPLEKITALQNPPMVINNGRIVVKRN
jgi:imidazolonepropionase-like amidohydrolase